MPRLLTKETKHHLPHTAAAIGITCGAQQVRDEVGWTALDWAAGSKAVGCCCRFRLTPIHPDYHTDHSAQDAETGPDLVLLYFGVAVDEAHR
jgi:hypothetical protein